MREDSAAGFYYDQILSRTEHQDAPPGALAGYENLGGYADISGDYSGDYSGAAPQLVVRNTALESEAQVYSRR